MKLAPLLSSLLLTGCYQLADAGYFREAASHGTGGGEIVVRTGAGDLREEKQPWGLESDFRLGVGGDLLRWGFGAAAQFAPRTGWDSDWTPFWRVGGFPLQVERVRREWGLGISPFAEAGVLFLEGQETRNRTLWSLGARLDYTIRSGTNAAFVSIFVGWGQSESLGPLS